MNKGRSDRFFKVHHQKRIKSKTQTDQLEKICRLDQKEKRFKEKPIRMICRILNQFITYAKLQDYPSKQRHHHSIIQDHAELEDELDELNSNSSFDKMLKSDLTIKVQASPSLVIKTQSELNLLNENDNFITDQQLSDPIIKNIKTSNQFYLSTSDLFESIDPNLLEFIS